MTADVHTVQVLLKARQFDPGPADGACGPRTVGAIRGFQATFLAHADGLIEPGRATWQRLEGSAPMLPAEWGGDSAQWPQEKKLRSMNPMLATKVRALLTALTQRQFQPKVFYGWRSVEVQARLFAMGRSKVKFSFHNAQQPNGTPNAYAADIIDGRYAWTPQAESSGFWKALGEEAHIRGLVWGGDWASFRDWAHVQLVQNAELSRIKRESGL